MVLEFSFIYAIFLYVHLLPTRLFRSTSDTFREYVDTVQGYEIPPPPATQPYPMQL